MARLLVVDDAAFVRKLLAEVLSRGGHEVVGEAADGVEAVVRYRELRPDVMTLDITMPWRDGLSALREVVGAFPGARVVMCSAHGEESKVREALSAGARDFVVTPFVADHMLSAVGRALV